MPAGVGMFQRVKDLFQVSDAVHDGYELRRKPVAERTTLDEFHLDNHGTIENVGRPYLHHVVMATKALSLRFNHRLVSVGIVHDDDF